MSKAPTPNFELLRTAAAIIDGIPDERVNLSCIVRDLKCPKNSLLTTTTTQQTQLDNVGCGTVGCALGWLSLHPDFRALGLSSDFAGEILWNGVRRGYIDVGSNLFNIPQHDSVALFGPGWSDNNRGLSDKQLFRQRVIRFLERHGQPVSGQA